MPIITIHGIPSNFSDKDVVQIRKDIRKAIRVIDDLPRKTTILIPKDRQEQKNAEIIFFVEVWGTHSTPSETNKVMRTIISVLKEYFSNVEGFTRKLIGYWT